ncbi:hypothetical protein E3N88_27884 [Mikania micrantha]|uniref:Uncharacterized protein n=1 Tax=Mikania micrantha TaxID=192012 RepID=A0A5N6MXY0_9ASTR|nr:hypothetical protein E3N88_27884 [Mikania micrantha]
MFDDGGMAVVRDWLKPDGVVVATEFKFGASLIIVNCCWEISMGWDHNKCNLCFHKGCSRVDLFQGQIGFLYLIRSCSSITWFVGHFMVIVGDYAYDNMVYLWGPPTFFSVVKGNWNGDLKAPANGCELSGRCKESSPNDPAGLWEWPAAWVGQICRGGLFRQIEMWADWCCKGPAVVYTLWPFDQAWMCRGVSFWYGWAVWPAAGANVSVRP